MMKFLGYFTIFLVIGIAIALFLFTRQSNILMPSAEPSKMPPPVSDDWQIFSSPKNNFQVYFPRPPIEADQKVGQRTYHIFTSEGADKELYIVTVIQFPSAVAVNALEDIQKAVLLSSPDNEFVQGGPILLNQLQGYEFIIKNPYKETHTLGFIMESKIYLLTVIRPIGEIKDEINARFFLNSFQTLP